VSDLSILRAGETCWRRAPAARVAVLVDGADYFDAVADALERAERRVIVVGWSVHPGTPLRVPDDGRPPLRLADALVAALEARPGLEARLGEPDGPEVVLVTARDAAGWLGQSTIDVLRSRRIARVRAADRHGRFRAYYPVARDGAREEPVYVHSKVAVDEALARVGSANAANRSMGFDTELDLALETGGDARLVPLRTFAVGTAVGIVPILLFLTVLVAAARAAVTGPSPTALVGAVALAVLVPAGWSFGRFWLASRRRVP